MQQRYQAAGPVRGATRQHWQEGERLRGAVLQRYQEGLHLRGATRQHWQETLRLRCAVLHHYQQGLLARAETIDAFLAREGYDDIAVIYDVANALAAGEDPADGAARLAPRLGVVHLSDTPRGGWRHDPIGTGDVDFASVGASLRKARFAGPTVLEIIADDPVRGIADGIVRLEAAGWNFPRSRTN